MQLIKTINDRKYLKVGKGKDYGSQSVTEIYQ